MLKQSHNEILNFNNLETTPLEGGRPHTSCVESPVLSKTDVEALAEASISIYDRTCALARGLVLILEEHKCPQILIADCVAQLHDHLDTSSAEDVWVKRVKFVLAYPLAKYLRQSELPKKADIPFTWRVGGFNRWFRKRLMIFCSKNTHLFYSWFQAKRACLPCSEDHVNETYKEHLSRLTANDNGDVPTMDSIFRDTTFQHVLRRIRSDITNNYEAKQFSLAPSTSACFSHKRSENGQYGFIRNYQNYDYITDAFDTELITMGFVPCGYYGSIKQYNVVYESRCYNSHGKTMDINRSLTNCELVIVNNPNLSCCIQAVIEPLKVRVISKGPALPYYLMHTVQQAMHDSMRKMECFRLIGMPFSATMLYDLAEKSKSYFKWLSIDYSAATDGLSWKYTKQILGYLISGLPSAERRIAMAVLGPHKLFYPIDGGSEYRGLQNNGQLMGSILSFPILCLANLGVYLRNTQALQESWSDKERLRHVLVNGDDMLYAAPSNYFETHKTLSSSVGLAMSPGKAYVHETYLNINSVSVHYNLSKLNPTHKLGDRTGKEGGLFGKGTISPWRIDFLNTGLFFGNHKVMGNGEEKHTFLNEGGVMKQCFYGDVCYGKLIQNINTILEGSLPGRQKALLESFLRSNKSTIDMDTTYVYINGNTYTRNLFLPIELGGFGVIPPLGWRFQITKSQKRVAMCLIASKNISKNNSSSKLCPLQGFALEPLDKSVSTSYRITEGVITGHEQWCEIYGKYLDCRFLRRAGHYSTNPAFEHKCKRAYKRLRDGFNCFSLSKTRVSLNKYFEDPNLATLLYRQLELVRDLHDDLV